MFYIFTCLMFKWSNLKRIVFIAYSTANTITSLLMSNDDLPVGQIVCNILDGAWSKNMEGKILTFLFLLYNKAYIYWCNKVLFLFPFLRFFSELLCIHHNAIVALTSGINVKERNRSKKWRRNRKERYNSQMCSTKIINIQEWWSTETK